MRRPLYTPQPIWVRENGEGEPLAVRTRSGWAGVEQVLERWEVEEDWWEEAPIARAYFRVLLSTGAVLTLFRDLRTGRWFRQQA